MTRISLFSLLSALLCALLPLVGKAQTAQNDTLRRDTIAVVNEVNRDPLWDAKSDSLPKIQDTVPQSEEETVVVLDNPLLPLNLEPQILNLDTLLHESDWSTVSSPISVNDSTLYEIDEETLIETLRQLSQSQITSPQKDKHYRSEELLRYQMLIQLLTQQNAHDQPTMMRPEQLSLPAERKSAVAHQAPLSSNKGQKIKGTGNLPLLSTGIDALGHIAVLTQLQEQAAATSQRLQALEAQQAALFQQLQQQRDTTYRLDVPTLQTPIVFPSTQIVEIPADFKRSVFFRVGSAQLSRQAETTLDEAVRFLHRFPQILFDLQGFASPEGNLQRNLRLGEERIAAVARYLAAKGIGSDRLRSASYGQIDHISQHQLGRRVDIALIQP